MTDITNFYISFGTGTPYGRMMMKVPAKERSEVIEYIQQYKIPNWCSIYIEADALAQAKEWELIIVPVPRGTLLSIPSIAKGIDQ